MKNRSRNVYRIVLTLVALFLLTTLTAAQKTSSVKKIIHEVQTVTKIAKGTFEVKLTPLAAEENVGDPLIARLALEKQFSGALTGTSKGQMLGIGTDLKDSGGYVAAERFTGTLDGKKGSFSLQHSGTMQAGTFVLNVIVVPDSGTGELTGITGKMNIIIKDGKHLFEFEYSFAKPK